MKKIIDIEEFSNSNESVPKAMKYRIKVDGKPYIVEVDKITGKDILLLANKNPYTRFQLNQKKKGVIKKVDYDETIDLTEPGLEKFMTLPLDQTEG